MKKRIFSLIAIILMLTGCGRKSADTSNTATATNPETSTESTIPEDSAMGTQITELESGFSYAEMKGDYAFNKFLSNGGAESDSEVINFLSKNIIGDAIISYRIYQ